MLAQIVFDNDIGLAPKMFDIMCVFPMPLGVWTGLDNATWTHFDNESKTNDFVQAQSQAWAQAPAQAVLLHHLPMLAHLLKVTTVAKPACASG